MPMSTSAPKRGLWANGDFMKLWSGETVAQIGSQVTQLAMPLLVLGTPGSSAAEVGLVTAMQTVPALCVTPFAGLLIDSFDRRRILLVANLVRALALALVPVLVLTDGVTIGALCVIAFVVGSGTAVFDVAYVAYLPALVPRHQLVDANGKLQGTYTVAQVGGPGLGGFLVHVLGAWVAVATNVATYLMAYVAMLVIRHRPAPRDPDAAVDRPKLVQIVTSFRLLWRNRVLRLLTLQSGWFNLCWYAVLTLFLVYAVQRLHMGAGRIGAALTVGSLASLTGAVVAKRLGERFELLQVLVPAIGVAAFAPMFLLPTGGGTSPMGDFLLVAVLFALYGFGLTIYNVHVVAYRQSVIPSEVLGRASAAYRLVTHGPISLGAFLGGQLGTRVGLWNAIAVFAVASALGWIRFATACRRLPAPERALAGTLRS
jgi:MFS family permease